MTVWELMQELTQWGDPNADIDVKITINNMSVELGQDFSKGDEVFIVGEELEGDITSAGFNRYNSFCIEVESK